MTNNGSVLTFLICIIKASDALFWAFLSLPVLGYVNRRSGSFLFVTVNVVGNSFQTSGTKGMSLREGLFLTIAPVVSRYLTFLPLKPSSCTWPHSSSAISSNLEPVQADIDKASLSCCGISSVKRTFNSVSVKSLYFSDGLPTPSKSRADQSNLSL